MRLSRGGATSGQFVSGGTPPAPKTLTAGLALSDSALSEPTEVFRLAVDAVTRERWLEAAALFDPASLARFRRRMLEQFAPAEPRRRLSAEDYLRQTPDLPREVAEYYVKQAERHFDLDAQLREALPGVTSVEALRALGPAEVFARWLEGRSPRQEILRMVEHGHVSRATAERRLARLDADSAPRPHFEAVGSVPDGDRVTHVLYRPAYYPDQPLSATAKAMIADAEARIAQLDPDEQELVRDTWRRSWPQIATCRRQPDGSWRLIADESFLRLSGIGMLDFDEPEEAGGPDDGATETPAA